MDYSPNPMPAVLWLNAENRKILPSWQQVRDTFQGRKAVIALVQGTRNTVTGGINGSAKIVRFEIADEPKPYALK